MTPQKWRAFYLAIHFSILLQCVDFFSDAVNPAPDNASGRHDRSWLAPTGKRDEKVMGAR